MKVPIALLFLLTSGCSSVMRSIDRAFLKPVKNEIVTPAEFGLRFEAQRIEVDDGVSLQAWFLPASD